MLSMPRRAQWCYRLHDGNSSTDFCPRRTGVPGCSKTIASLAQLELCGRAPLRPFASVFTTASCHKISVVFAEPLAGRGAQKRRPCIARDGGDNTHHKHERRGLHNLSGGFTFFCVVADLPGQALPRTSHAPRGRSMPPPVRRRQAGGPTPAEGGPVRRRALRRALDTRPTTLQ